MTGVEIELGTPGVDELADVVRALGAWQHDDAPLQLHPGDLGWAWRHGADATAAAVRTWRSAGELVAVGFLDGPGLVRLTVTPSGLYDEQLAERLVADLADPGRGLLADAEAAVEAPNGSAVQDLLLDAGWSLGEPWTPLCRDLDEPVKAPHLSLEVVGPEQARDYTAVHRSAFGSPHLTDERWRTMADGPAFADARSLVAYDDAGHPVAEVTVWSAGPGRPGLLEPMGVHADHRGHGHGRAICVAAAAALQELGSSQALVCTRSANAGGVATYLSAGYAALPERLDRTRA